MKTTVLFLCATNGVQSPMAEAMLRRMDSEHFQAWSAAVQPAEMHPLTIEVMKEIDVDLATKVRSSVTEFQNREFDFVITLCDRARSNCPKFPKAEVIHWQFEDPTLATDVEKQRRAFRMVRDQIAQRLKLFVLVQVREKALTMSVDPERPPQPSLVP